MRQGIFVFWTDPVELSAIGSVVEGGSSICQEVPGTEHHHSLTRVDHVQYTCILESLAS